jgi:hypothetical protein
MRELVCVTKSEATVVPLKELNFDEPTLDYMIRVKQGFELLQRSGSRLAGYL